MNAIKSMGTPFLEFGPDLTVLGCHDVLPDAVVQTVPTIKTFDQEQYNAYRASGLEQRTSSVHDPIKKNSFRFFRCPSKARQADKTKELKDDVGLFWRHVSILWLRPEIQTLVFSSNMKTILTHRPFWTEANFVQETKVICYLAC